jgi:hypothetical protein
MLTTLRIYTNLMSRSAGCREGEPMADEAKKPLNADELTEDDLRTVTGGSTPLNVPEITKNITGWTVEAPPTQSDSGKTTAGWDLPVNSAE